MGYEVIAFVAQGLEHWSCKPGVESSNLSEGFYLPAKELEQISHNYLITKRKHNTQENTWGMTWSEPRVSGQQQQLYSSSAG